MYPAAYGFYRYRADKGDVFSRNKSLSMLQSPLFTNDDLPGNLMHQGAAKNSNGKSVSGYKITRDQLNSIFYKFINGDINKGKQK